MFIHTNREVILDNYPLGP